MSTEKNMKIYKESDLEPDNLRAEIARHRISKRQMAKELNISYSYLLKILSGIRPAFKRRFQIYDYILRRSR